MQSVDIEDIGNQSSTLLQFNVTDIASLASDRALCARFLPLILEDRLLRQQRRARYVGHGQLQHDFDPYDKLRGDVLEQHWRSELCRRNKCECNEPETPWLKFLDKLEQLPAGKSMVAAEVELAACPLLQPADSTAGSSLVAGITLNGRADFIEVFWEEPQVGASCKCPLRPALRIHECKASGQVQASHRLQATLYLLILERLVHEAKGLRFQGQQAFAPKDVRLECTVVLGTVVSGEEVKHHEEVPIKEKEIKALRSSMTPILQRGSHHLARVLAMHEESRNGGASNPLAEPRLPFQLGRQCTSCKAQARCWAQCAEGDGEIQLSGCTSGQAVQLQDGGVKTLLDLKQTCLADICTILGQDKQQQQPGSLDAESLKVMAEVRSGRVETVGEHGVSSHTEVLLKPGVGPSKLPLDSLSLYHVSTSVLSTSSSSTPAGSVAGLAALIKRGRTEETLFVQLAGDAQPHISNSSSSGSSSRQGAPQHHKRSAMVHPSTGLAGRGTILSATNRGGAHPAVRCGESAAGQEQQAAAEKETGLLQSFAEWLVASIEDASAAEEATFHFYFHSKKQVHVLVSRCIQLANELQVNSKPWQLLMLLPQLLGQRFGVLGEQQMHSVLEEELSRFATKWEGRALVTATQQRWTPGKAPFIWSGIQWPLPGAQAPGPVQTKILSDDVPPTVLQLHFYPSKSSSSSIQQHYLHGDLGELYSAAATGDSLQRLLECSVRAVDWLRDSMTRAEDSNNWGTGSSSQDRRAVSAMPTAKGPLRREKGPTLLGGPKAPEDDVSAADELTRAMAEAARLERVTTIYGFCIERVCCSTPQQRAGSNPEVCEIAEVQQAASHYADSALSARPCLRGSQLHTRLRLREGDSVMVTLCSGGTNRCQAAADVLSRCVPMQVVSVCSHLDQTLRCVELKEDAFVMNSAGRSSFSAVNQPYFLCSARSVDSFPQGATVVVEKADINIGGYLCKRVCERLRKPAQCQPAAQMLLLPLQSSPSGSAVGSAPVSTVSDLGICQELRPEQEQLVTCCRQSCPRLHMLQGPPGTGKTETMACAVIAVALDAVKKGQAMIIYVSAITRPAVDGLMTRIGRRQAEASCSQKDNLIVDSIESLKKRDCAECRSRQLGRVNQATFASSCCGTHLKMSSPK
ncbi:hypothetical protein DUNSADRAFT_14727 [Dunaliella salina]|uniref:DNA2/NAM7 helicase helicase domain-containing protein n=1 Tax=Dunaliella salina TaxID=3046 RepID=A0ABQ7H2D9_DUNSA|nr:hypothetical protein DUNSADRAFT_14727 [Dunaliella salina]|eukprot:KAF5841020.1 hypothetical protein DUNSADRAFT_14727 [Dunaliella salina]